MTCGFVGTSPPARSDRASRGGLGDTGSKLIENRAEGGLEVIMCSLCTTWLARWFAQHGWVVYNYVSFGLGARFHDPTRLRNPLTN